MYGFGEYVEGDNLSSQFLSQSSNYLSEDNKIKSNFENSYTAFNINYSFKSNDIKWNSSYISDFNFNFPLGDSKFVSLGLSPYTVSGLDFEEDSYSSGLSYIYKTYYSNNGGISNAYINFIYNVFNKVSFAVRYSYLFGNLEQNKTTKI